MTKLENLDYLHLELINLVARHLQVDAKAVVANENLEDIIYSIQDDQMSGLDCLDLMAKLAVKRHLEALELEREQKATQTIKARHYWESLLAE